MLEPMVVVDSSVWIDFFRAKSPALVTKLCALLDSDLVALAAPVRLELLAGASRTELARLKRVLSALPLLLPGTDVWLLLEDWVVRSRSKGERFGALDLLIAGIAHEHSASLWSLDGDFGRMAALGFVQRFIP